MISGVIFMLFGLAMVLRSQPHALWAATFAAINAIYIPLLEEPLPALRFGADYERYCRIRPVIPTMPVSLTARIGCRSSEVLSRARTHCRDAFGRNNRIAVE